MISDEFDREGYVIVPRVLSAEMVATIRAAYLPRFLASQSHTIPDILLSDPTLRRVVTSGPLADALTAILGQPYLLPPYNSVDYERYVSFHTDTTGIELDGATFHKEPGFRMVTVGIYLQDTDRLQVVPGSHTEPDPYLRLRLEKNRQREAIQRNPVKRLLHRFSSGQLYNLNTPFETHPRAITPEAKAGDAFIFDLRLIHGATPKRHGTSGKLGIFWKAGAHHPTTEAYAAHVMGLPANAYLRDPVRAQAVAALNADMQHVRLL